MAAVGPDQQVVQSVLWEVLFGVTQCIAPILPDLVEELYDQYFTQQNKVCKLEGAGAFSVLIIAVRQSGVAI